MGDHAALEDRNVGVERWVQRQDDHATTFVDVLLAGQARRQNAHERIDDRDHDHEEHDQPGGDLCAAWPLHPWRPRGLAAHEISPPWPNACATLLAPRISARPTMALMRPAAAAIAYWPAAIPWK